MESSRVRLGIAFYPNKNGDRGNLSLGEKIESIHIVLGHLAIAFSALLPLINPIGSALILFGMVGPQSPKVYRSLARSVAINLVLFFAIIEIVGSAILKFFGISLPIVQVAARDKRR